MGWSEEIMSNNTKRLGGSLGVAQPPEAVGVVVVAGDHMKIV